MKIVHPDSGHAPDAELARQLNEAREAALVDSRSTALVPIEAVLDLVRAASSSATAVNRRDASERVVNRVVLQHVGQFAGLRRRRTAIAAAAGGVAAVVALLRSTMRIEFIYPWELVVATIFVVAGSAAAALGVMAWLVSSREKLLVLELEGAAETLGDKAAFTETIRELGVGDAWTRNALQAAVTKWVTDAEGTPSPGVRGGSVPLQSTARELGPVDFARILLAKGLETGVFEESEIVDPDGQRQYGFRVRFA
jgi:hypothetical protein